MSILKVGIIGCGAFARAQHLPNCHKNPNLQVIWACDIDIDKAQAVCQDFSIPNATDEPENIFADETVDVVILATSHHAHLELIAKAAAAGKHIMCEKPMALKLDDALEIVRIVQRHKIKFCVDHNRRCAPAMKDLKKSFFDFKRQPQHQPWRFYEMERDQFRDEQNPVFLVRIQDESSSHRVIHKDPVYGGGAIIGESTHWYDLISWFFENDEPVNIQAWGSCIFNHGVTIEFRSGALGTLLFNTGGTFDYPKELYELTWNGAIFRNECFLENQIYGIPGVGKSYYPLQHDDLSSEVDEPGMQGFMQKLDYAHQHQERKFDLIFDKGHEAMLADFADAIINDHKSPCDAIDGFRAVYIANLAIESIKHGHRMPVEMRFWHTFVTS